jgi:hypothetical protein
VSEDRNPYGFPCLDTPEPEESETWREELSGAEAAVFDAVLSGVRRATRGMVADTTALWCAEETLWQLRCLAKKADLLDLPGAGRWRKVRP